MPGTIDTVDLKPLYATVLEPRLNALEDERLKLKRTILKCVLLIGLPVLGFCQSGTVGLVLPEGARGLVAPVAVVLIVVGLMVALSKYALPGFTAYVNYRARFKREVVAEIFKAVCPGASYAPDRHITPELFTASGIFAERGRMRGDDLVRGRIGDTPFEACEMQRTYSTSGEDSRTETIFHGLFFHLDFNKKVSGRTIVQPQKARNVSLASRGGDLSRVALEDPRFEQEFEVYATNPVEARYILTPALMEGIVSLHAQTGREICLAFADNRAFVAVHFGRALFEPSIRQTTSFEALSEMADHFRLAHLVVHELDLNTRIWTKEVDAALLEAAPVVSPMESLSTGDVRMENLLARIGKDIYADQNTGDAPETPRRTRVRFESDGDGVIVRFRVAWWAWTCMLLSLVCALPLAALAGLFVVPDRVRPLIEPWFELPPPDATQMLTSVAMIPVGIATLVGAFLSLYWIAYVRRVRIGRDEFVVTRGLSPFARRYPRTGQSRILQTDRMLYLGQADAPKLINPSLSPMLRTKEEARWVAWEMRRAMDQIR